MKFIQYTLFGEIVEQYYGVCDQLEAYPFDQKVRITMDNDMLAFGILLLSKTRFRQLRLVSMI